MARHYDPDYVPRKPIARAELVTYPERHCDPDYVPRAAPATEAVAEPEGPKASKPKAKKSEKPAA